jgi:hypothetical protein
MLYALKILRSSQPGKKRHDQALIHNKAQSGIYRFIISPYSENANILIKKQLKFMGTSLGGHFGELAV